MIEQKLRTAIRDIPDFPKPGIIFKDITPILQDPILCREVTDAFIDKLKGIRIDAVVGIESRGFLFAMLLANQLEVPFVPIRKQGKLPYTTIEEAYELEYGTATIEVHKDSFDPGSRILLHDDLLATGGTVVAASKLIEKLGGKIAAYAFIISLDFLNPKSRLLEYSDEVISLVSY